MPALTQFGLSGDADLVYRTLAGGACDTRAAGIARELGVSSARIRAALLELESAGVAVQVTRDGWAVAEPRFAARRLVLRRVPEAPGTRRVPGRELYRRARQLLDRAQHEHLGMYPGLVADEDVARRALPAARERRLRGVRLRTLAPIGAAAPNLPPDDLAVLDGNHRRLPDLTMTLHILDRRVALLPTDLGDPDGDHLEVHAAPLVAGLHALFEQHWAAAAPAAPAPLTSRERAVVELLAQGLTDAGVARRLGISERTVTYTLRGLLDRYGARSRFQLATMLQSAALPPH